MPVLIWDVPDLDPMADVIARLQATAIGATEILPGTLPLRAYETPRLTFTIGGDQLTVTSDQSSLGLFEGQAFKVAPRLAWFLNEGGTLGVCVRTSRTTWGATALNGAPFPLLAAHEGSTQSKAFTSILEHSERWVFIRPFNQSLFSDALDAPDHHFRFFGATPASADLPQINYSGTCVGCGSSEQSREHCLPNWIASTHKVIPVTAPVFCEPCNNYFGVELERPIAHRFQAGTLRHRGESELLARWAVKTSLTLAAASGVLLDPTWGRDLRHGQVPNGFEVFAHWGGSMAPGYVYAVTQFSRALADAGAFLFTFAMDGLVFVTVRAPIPLGQLPVFERVLPYSPVEENPDQSGEINLNRLHQAVLEAITGEKTDFNFSRPKAVHPRK